LWYREIRETVLCVARLRAGCRASPQAEAIATGAARPTGTGTGKRVNTPEAARPGVVLDRPEFVPARIRRRQVTTLSTSPSEPDAYVTQS